MRYFTLSLISTILFSSQSFAAISSLQLEVLCLTSVNRANGNYITAKKSENLKINFSDSKFSVAPSSDMSSVSKFSTNPLSDEEKNALINPVDSLSPLFDPNYDVFSLDSKTVIPIIETEFLFEGEYLDTKLSNLRGNVSSYKASREASKEKLAFLSSEEESKKEKKRISDFNVAIKKLEEMIDGLEHIKSNELEKYLAKITLRIVTGLSAWQSNGLTAEMAMEFYRLEGDKRVLLGYELKSSNQIGYSKQLIAAEANNFVNLVSSIQNPEFYQKFWTSQEAKGFRSKLNRVVNPYSLLKGELKEGTLDRESKNLLELAKSELYIEGENALQNKLIGEHIGQNLVGSCEIKIDRITPLTPPNGGLLCADLPDYFKNKKVY